MVEEAAPWRLMGKDIGDRLIAWPLEVWPCLPISCAWLRKLLTYKCNLINKTNKKAKYKRRH